jgi:hypothetical protein
VQGSAKQPYKITAEGEGDALRVFCSCPAGRKGGKFCKHVAYLLQGDVTKLESHSTLDVEELHRRAIGSPYQAKADARVSADINRSQYSGLTTIDAILAQLQSKLGGMGWVAKISRSDDLRKAEYLELRCFFKNGKLRATPSLTLEFVPFDYEYEGDWNDGDYSEDSASGQLKERSRPWGVRGKGSKSQGTWGKPEAAIEKFIALAEQQKP